MQMEFLLRLIPVFFILCGLQCAEKKDSKQNENILGYLVLHSAKNSCQKTEDLKNEILTLVADKSCVATNQCQTIPFGSKPCGGAWEYVVYSTLTANQQLVELKAEELTAVSKQCNNDSDLVSTCDIIYRPEVECRNSLCAKVSP